MKRILFAAAFWTLSATVCHAQATELEMVRSQFKLDKKTLIGDLMQLSEGDAAKFWPLYNDYERERSAVGDRRIKLIQKYADNYSKIDATIATELWKESTSIQKSEAELREKYAEKMKKQISAQVALKFYMSEDRIATAVKDELYNQMPIPGQ